VTTADNAISYFQTFDFGTEFSVFTLGGNNPDAVILPPPHYEMLLIDTNANETCSKNSYHDYNYDEDDISVHIHHDDEVTHCAAATKNNEQKEKYIDDENDFLQGFDYGDVTSLKLILTEAPLIDTEAAYWDFLIVSFFTKDYLLDVLLKQYTFLVSLPYIFPALPVPPEPPPLYKFSILP